MKTFILVFAWIPIVMVFSINGPGGSSYIFWTMFLLAIFVGICEATFRHHAEFSDWLILMKYDAEIERAFLARNDQMIFQLLSAKTMYEMRGA